MHVPHELKEEFSAEAALIERLRKSSHEFGQLASRYDEVNADVHRIESGERPAEDAVVEKLRKQRLRLKDDIAAFLLRVERRM
jgi:uncharacterized protein YdcH (DUF465 family)